MVGTKPAEVSQHTVYRETSRSLEPGSLTAHSEGPAQPVRSGWGTERGIPRLVARIMLDEATSSFTVEGLLRFHECRRKGPPRWWPRRPQ